MTKRKSRMTPPPLIEHLTTPNQSAKSDHMEKTPLPLPPHGSRTDDGGWVVRFDHLTDAPELVQRFAYRRLQQWSANEYQTGIPVAQWMVLH